MNSEAAYGMVLFYSLDFFPKLAAMTQAEIVEVLKDAQAAVNMYPVGATDKKGEPLQVKLGSLGERNHGYAVAVMSAYLIWTQKHLLNNPLPDSPLLDAAYTAYKIYRDRLEAPDKEL